MNEKTEGANKIVTCGLLFTAQLFSFMIRFAFGVVAPVLMEMYRISPKAMGYVLSGWNWSYTAGLPIMGVTVDRFGPYIVLGVGSLVWGLFTVALPIAASAVPLFWIGTDNALACRSACRFPRIQLTRARKGYSGCFFGKPGRPGDRRHCCRIHIGKVRMAGGLLLYWHRQPAAHSGLVHFVSR